MLQILNKLSGWLRAALLFTIVWCVSVVGLAFYERFITIGDINGPWALYDHYGSLVFHHVEISDQSFSFWLKTQKFYTTLLLPPVIVWLIVAGLLPSLRWVRNGFRT